MCGCDRRDLLGAAAGLLASAVLVGATSAAADPTPTRKVYTCPPCGCPNDGKEFDAPGLCTVCQMPLVEKPAAPETKPGGAKASPRARRPDAPVRRSPHSSGSALA